MTATDIIIALVFIACCLICYARGLRDGKKDAIYEASLKQPRARKLVVVNAKSTIDTNATVTAKQWEFRPKSLGNPEPV